MAAERTGGAARFNVRIDDHTKYQRVAAIESISGGDFTLLLLDHTGSAVEVRDVPLECHPLVVSVVRWATQPLRMQIDQSCTSDLSVLIGSLVQTTCQRLLSADNGILRSLVSPPLPPGKPRPASARRQRRPINSSLSIGLFMATASCETRNGPSRTGACAPMRFGCYDLIAARRSVRFRPEPRCALLRRPMVSRNRR